MRNSREASARSSVLSTTDSADDVVHLYPKRAFAASGLLLLVRWVQIQYLLCEALNGFADKSEKRGTVLTIYKSPQQNCGQETDDPLPTQVRVQPAARYSPGRPGAKCTTAHPNTLGMTWHIRSRRQMAGGRKGEKGLFSAKSA
jgi:hypothetical protein